DAQIQRRLANIFGQISELSRVTVTVRDGVVILGGEVSRESQAERAVNLALRVQGAVTVEDAIERTLDVGDNLEPALDQLRDGASQTLRAAPLIAVAVAVFLVIGLVGNFIARRDGLWHRLAPNGFLAELLAQSFRFVAWTVAVLAALSVLGATTLLGTVLGGAGVIGLAIGFAVRDTLENYISSIMLSLRQPFRANDHVIINEHEGKVVRLTSRATVLMTLDGNHLRIPNSTVFKGTILNYTRNPERRFDFSLGVDANDDPVAAMSTALAAIRGLDFVLDDPAPNSVISSVGDSNIVLLFVAWVDQRETDFGKARSLAIRAAKNALEGAGFTLPEPIYRLRFDSSVTLPAGAASVSQVAAPEPQRPVPPSIVDAEALDVSPDTHLEEKVNAERAEEAEHDLLDDDRPVE
ncbi:MAG: mechanosensitive ion channel, partial [Xanthomonadales bacterium]|nr:mechanosensitive ion channel [Xanthomonadales bacterium]